MRAPRERQLGDTVSIGSPSEGGSLRFVVTTPRGTFTKVLPPGESLRIGRSPECDIRVDDDSVSRIHAVIRTRPLPSVEDAGSRNGTVVLGTRLRKGESLPLPLGGVIELGQAVLVLQRVPLEEPREAEGAPTTPVIASQRMRELYETATHLAASLLPVLVRGETGAGKELVALAIHKSSTRAGGPYVPLNCAALNETLLESELFGYVKGAFTGASQNKLGLFEAASGGTMFLDEIGELSLTIQAKLLRVLDSGEILPLGSNRSKRVDVRFVAATHRDLGALVRAGKFREDLYFRLDGVTIDVPPLRERPDDILPLAESFVRTAAARLGRPPPSFDPETTRLLLSHPWPGNVRELRNTVERAVALARGAPVLRPADLRLRDLPHAAAPSLDPRPPWPAPGDNPDAPDDALARERVVEALARAAGNQTVAAKLLGVSRSTLIRRLEHYGLGRPRKEGA